MTDRKPVLCHEAVTRQDEEQPCHYPAVAYRKDPEGDAPYPVCLRHTRHDMVPLRHVIQYGRRETDKLDGTHAGTGRPPLMPWQFDPGYQLRMIQAYPVIAGLTADELMDATPEQKREAFTRILTARNLRRTHEMYLEDKR